PVHDDAFTDGAQVRAGVAAHSQTPRPDEGVDHAGRGGLAVGAGDMDDTERALWLTQQVEQCAHTFQGRVDLRFGCAGHDLRGDLGVALLGAQFGHGFSMIVGVYTPASLRATTCGTARGHGSGAY